MRALIIGSGQSDLSGAFSNCKIEPWIIFGVAFPNTINIVNGGQNSFSGGKRRLSGSWGQLLQTSVGRTLLMKSGIFSIQWFISSPHNNQMLNIVEHFKQSVSQIGTVNAYN